MIVFRIVLDQLFGDARQHAAFTGQAWVTGSSEILIDDTDPFAWGIRGDTVRA